MNKHTFWQYFIEQCECKRLAHALLLTGKDAEGLSKRVAEFLFCIAATDKSCGACKGCLLMQSETPHPDFFELRPEGKLNLIKIDSVRELIESLKQTAQQGGVRLAVIHEADAMNIAAANALLKSLEEPPPKTYFILITQKPNLLLPTIKSRCQVIHIKSDDEVSALSFQDLIEGMVDGEDPLLLAQKHKKEDLSALLDAVFFMLSDLVKIKTIKGRHGSLHYPDFRFKFEPLAARLPMPQLFQFLDNCYTFRRELNLKISINADLFLENMLISWYDLVLLS